MHSTNTLRWRLYSWVTRPEDHKYGNTLLSEGNSRPNCTTEWRLFILYRFHNPTVIVLFSDVEVDREKENDSKVKEEWTNETTFIDGITLEGTPLRIHPSLTPSIIKHTSS